MSKPLEQKNILEHWNCSGWCVLDHNMWRILISGYETHPPSSPWTVSHSQEDGNFEAGQTVTRSIPSVVLNQVANYIQYFQFSWPTHLERIFLIFTIYFLYCVMKEKETIVKLPILGFRIRFWVRSLDIFFKYFKSNLDEKFLE